MRISSALSLLLPLTLVAAAGCGVPALTTADNRQDAIISPLAMTGGVEISLASSGFSTLATAADVATLEFQIASSVLSAPKTQSFSRTSMPADKRVKFTDLPPGSYTVTSVAKDAGGQNIGSKSATVTVVAGKTAVVQLALKLVDTQVANPNGNLYIDFDLLDGDVSVKPIEEPSPTPSPSPSPSVSPSPSPSPSASATPNPNAGSLGLYNLVQRDLPKGHREISGTVHNNANVALNAELKVEFKEYKGVIFVNRRLEVVETKTVPFSIGGNKFHYFTVASSVDADDVTVSVSVK